VVDRETPDIIGSSPEEETEYACTMGPAAPISALLGLLSYAG